MSSIRIEPFWNRLPAIALYPFRGGALISLLAIGLGIVLLGWFPIFRILFWLLACKQAFEILLASANGRLISPHVSPGFDSSVVWKYLMLQVLMFGLPVLAAILVEPALGMALFIAFALVLPAAIMGLAVSGSLGRAINPELWFFVITRIGWPYLALIGLLLVIQLSAANAEAMLAEFLPATLSSVVGVVFSLWSMFATFHLMGYLIYQFHRELEFEPRAIGAALPPSPEQHRDRELLERVGAMVQAGDVSAAMQALRVEIRSRAVTLEVQELYRRLLQQSGASAELSEHGRQFLHQLLLEKQDKRALELARECIAVDPGFTALELEQNAALAKRAGFAGQSRLAIDLLLAAVRSSSRHPDKPLWALQAADLLSRQDGREAEARELLQRVRADCSDSGMCARIDAQLALLPS
jgi:hypothetical protein